jgi:8-oxo-dGTP pyrophosphatase MutT (NUDIX family)
VPILSAGVFTGLVPFASTDGWTVCALGHRHWGRAGAAGLFLHRDGVDGAEVLLQHRASWSHHGDTWGTPGGALHAAESAEQGALREAREELGLVPDDVVLGPRSVDDHGGWAYTTVLARPARSLEPTDLRLDGESNGVAWVALRRFGEVPLHPGLAASLPRLEALLREVGADL